METSKIYKNQHLFRFKTSSKEINSFETSIFMVRNKHYDFHK